VSVDDVNVQLPEDLPRWIISSDKERYLREGAQSAKSRRE